MLLNGIKEVKTIMEYPCLNDEKKLDTLAFAKTGEYLKESDKKNE